MPPPLSSDVLPTIDTLVGRNTSREQIVALGAQQIRRLREDLRAGADMTPQQQRKLERLQAIIGTRISLIEAAADISDDVRKDIVAELQSLREVMDKRFILPDYAPDSPDAVRKTLQFTAGSLDVGMRTLNAATRELPTVARVGIFAGAGVAILLAVKWLWDELGLIGKAVGTGIAGAAGFLGFQKLHENWTAIGGFFRGIKDTVSGWFGGESVDKQQQEKIGKQQDATTKVINDFLAVRGSPGEASILAPVARKAIEAERALIGSNDQQRKRYAPRLKYLEDHEKAITVFEAGLRKSGDEKAAVEKARGGAEPAAQSKTRVEGGAKDLEGQVKGKEGLEKTGIGARDEGPLKKAEMDKKFESASKAILLQVSDAINHLDANVPNLLNPPTEREVAGVRIRFAGNAILLDGRPLVIKATQLGLPWMAVTLNTLRRTGANLQANATASLIGVIPITRNPVFSPAKIAEALNRYKTGGLPHEEDEHDANNQPTGVRLRFSI